MLVHGFMSISYIVTATLDVVSAFSFSSSTSHCPSPPSLRTKTQLSCFPPNRNARGSDIRGTSSRIVVFRFTWVFRIWVCVCVCVYVKRVSYITLTSSAWVEYTFIHTHILCRAYTHASYEASSVRGCARSELLAILKHTRSYVQSNTYIREKHADLLYIFFVRNWRCKLYWFLCGLLS